MGTANEEAGQDNKALTLEEATARIRMLESLVGMLVEGLKNHQHELEMRGESSCGCCPASPTVYTTNPPIYVPEFV